MPIMKDAYDLVEMRRKELRKEFAPIHAFRNNQEKELDKIIKRIRDLLNSYLERETFLKGIYQEVDQAIVIFHADLISENFRAEINDNSVISTAKKLEQTLPIILDPKTQLEKKHEAAQDFYNYTRHAKISEKAKIVAGVVIGGALVAAGCIALVVCTGGLGVGIAAAIPFIIGPALLMTAFGATFGMMGGIAAVAAVGQHDRRGKSVSNNLKTLIQERNKLHKSEPTVPTSAPQALINPGLPRPAKSAGLAKTR